MPADLVQTYAHLYNDGYLIPSLDLVFVRLRRSEVLTEARRMNQRFLVFALLLSPQMSWADEPSKLDWQTRAAEQARIVSEVKWTPVADTMPNPPVKNSSNGLVVQKLAFDS